MIGDDEVIYSEYGSTRHGSMAGSNLVTAQDRGLQHYICIPLYPTISILHPPPGIRRQTGPRQDQTRLLGRGVNKINHRLQVNKIILQHEMQVFDQ